MNRHSSFALLSTLLVVTASVQAGNRLDVLDALNQIQGNWPEADLRATVTGITSDEEAVLDTTIRYAFVASEAGHAQLVHVSSHGDITVLRSGAAPGTSGQSDPFKVKPPLGNETVYVLFSSEPLDVLFPEQSDAVELGDSTGAATGLVSTLATAAKNSRLSIQRLDYRIVAEAGGTQYTGRGIERALEESERGGTGTAATPVSGSGPRITAQGAAFPTRVEFDFDSDRLTSRGRMDVDVFGDIMLQERWSAYAVTLEGHTDDVGSDAYNFDLSRRRAEAVRSYLIKSFGVDPGRLHVNPYGETRPSVPNSSDANRAVNRRVEFVFSRPAP